MIEIDGSDLERVAREYEGLAATAIPDLQKILRQTAVNVAKGLRADVKSSGSGRWGRFPNTISWDEKVLGDGFEYEIGPRPSGQGSLGGVVYDGGGRANSRTAPRADLTAPLQREEPRLLAKIDAFLGSL
ncbi:hypothetical protein JT358_11580 [Micrococcales bacterium 31B]|nr:hypothetical protein [Micrococcales bacterium 31B]